MREPSTQDIRQSARATWRNLLQRHPQCSDHHSQRTLVVERYLRKRSPTALTPDNSSNFCVGEGGDPQIGQLLASGSAVSALKDVGARRVAERRIVSGMTCR